MKKSMKHTLLLVLCIQLLLTSVLPLISFSTNSADAGSTSTPNKNTVSEIIEAGSTSVSIFPDTKLEWISYRDYVVNETLRIWENPKAYEGYEVIFNQRWGTVFCRSSFGVGTKMNNAPITEAMFNSTFIVEECYYDKNDDTLWFKIANKNGDLLPGNLAQNPYILYIYGSDITGKTLDYNPPTVFLLPRKAILRPDPNDEILLFASPSANAATQTYPISDFPAFLDYTPIMAAITDGLKADFYDLGEEYGEYRYVEAARVQLIDAEASFAYQRITESEDLYEYYQNIYETPSDLLAQFTASQKAALDVLVEELALLEIKSSTTNVTVGSITLPVTVYGNLPDYVQVNAVPVDTETVMKIGFDIKSAEDLLLALDITMTDTRDGTEWQPKEGRIVTVSIGVAELGYADDAILRAHRKHGDTVQDFDLIVVENGCVNLRVDGFSVYAVSEVGNTSHATLISDRNPVELQVGKETFYYADRNDNTNATSHGYDRGTWHVTDPLGAIHYTVHSNQAIGNGGMAVPWITIHPLKETPNAADYVTLQFCYNNGNNVNYENYKLKIIAPKATAAEKVKLYIKDDVNNSGRIVAALVRYNDTNITWYDKDKNPLKGTDRSYDITDGAYDEHGNLIHAGLQGADFSWNRDDDYLIIPTSYGDNYRSVNIALDHAGLVEARKDEINKKFVPTTYTLKVVLADGTPRDATYTVYYQSEIINSSFEFPNATDRNYTFFPNGWPELHWKTTAPGHTAPENPGQHISKDIEYGDVVNNNCNTDFGVHSGAGGSQQFAELNAEAFGALYQDIISVPGEDILWNFSHAPRPDQNNWARNVSNAMYIVIGPTEFAQKLTHTDLEALGNAADTKAAQEKQKNPSFDFEGCKDAVEVEYNGITYKIWFHDAGTYGYNADTTWTDLSGKYTTPEDQYRTRLFFMSKRKANSTNANAGNLIDSATGGQYKTFLVEYYLGTLTNDGHTLNVTKYDQKDPQTGKALVYSYEQIELLASLISGGTINGKYFYLQEIIINGENYPYSIRHKTNGGQETASLYIDKYPVAESFKAEKESAYKDYDIVVRIYLREVVISVEKEIMFPTNEKGEQLLTEEQKLTLIENSSTKYEAEFKITSEKNVSYYYEEKGSATITKRDPSGRYLGYYAVEDQPLLGHTYQITETKTTDFPGLIQTNTTYSTTLYANGQKLPDSVKETFTLEGQTNFAEVFVKNYYVEKQTTIKYVAVGNGKVAFGGDNNYMDTPTETLAFYSGKATGADVSAGKGATFVGWFTDPECTKPVTAVNGVVGKNPDVKNSSENYFRPNANILNADEVTFYAKFETASLTIERENAMPNQAFIYHIQSGADTSALDMYVTLQCDENGKGKVEIFEMLLGTYTVTELDEWSWRHPDLSNQQWAQTHTLTDTNNSHTFKFSGEYTDKDWLNDYSDSVPNIFGKSS